MINRRLFSVCLFVSLAGIVFLGWVFYTRLEAHRAFLEQARLSSEDAARIRAHVVRFREGRVLPGAIRLLPAIHRSSGRQGMG